MQCAKCGGQMVRGFVVDYMPGGQRKVGTWVEGEPKESFWHGVDISDAPQVQIVTYRCESCGFLESYAPLKE